MAHSLPLPAVVNHFQKGRFIMKTIKTILTGHEGAFRAISSTTLMCTKQRFDGGILSIAGGYFVSAVQFIMLTFIWAALDREGADLGGLNLNQLMTYTLMATILHQELNIISPATASLWEGSIIGRFMRPLPVPVSFIAETVGRWWIPSFLFFSLPLWIIAPLLGIDPRPASSSCGLLALLSLLLSASLGFAIDLLFAAFAMHLANGCWVATAIREAVYSLLSGEMIPFALFPWGLGGIFALLPFGSIAHAPLSIYIGTAAYPLKTISLQLLWNIVLWIAAAQVFKKSKERMISFGG